jgi:hypothetical protein
MAKQYPALTSELSDFIRQQKIFFVGTAAADGRVNVSPKGMDTLCVVSANRVVWLNLTGSGNETAAHLLENNRLTLMFCAFEGAPLILRLYGQAQAFHPRDTEWDCLIPFFPKIAGARQIVDVSIDLVQTSCGWAVPLFDFKADRDQLEKWAENKSAEDLQKYWEQRNQQSIDGKPTGIRVK